MGTTASRQQRRRLNCCGHRPQRLWIATAPEGDALLDNLAVVRAVRGQGVGSALVQRLLADSAVDAPAMISLTTRIPKFFLALGFEVVGPMDDAAIAMVPKDVEVVIGAVESNQANNKAADELEAALGVKAKEPAAAPHHIWCLKTPISGLSPKAFLRTAPAPRATPPMAPTSPMASGRLCLQQVVELPIGRHNQRRVQVSYTAGSLP